MAFFGVLGAEDYPRIRRRILLSASGATPGKCAISRFWIRFAMALSRRMATIHRLPMLTASFESESTFMVLERHFQSGCGSALAFSKIFLAALILLRACYFGQISPAERYFSVHVHIVRYLTAKFTIAASGLNACANYF